MIPYHNEFGVILLTAGLMIYGISCLVSITPAADRRKFSRFMRIKKSQDKRHVGLGVIRAIRSRCNSRRRRSAASSASVGGKAAEGDGSSDSRGSNSSNNADLHHIFFLYLSTYRNSHRNLINFLSLSPLRAYAHVGVCAVSVSKRGVA